MKTWECLRNEKCLIYTKVEGLDLSGEKAKLQKKARPPTFLWALLGGPGEVRGENEKVSTWGYGFGSQVSLFLGGGSLRFRKLQDGGYW